ncbi:hypothetical protein [Laspinema palackyanum]|uniref:hypothetical protein n=1 Tax=Laspinema palackyanum TaxID=3231601 RepID=UPI00349F2E77
MKCMIVELLLLGILFPLDVAQAGEVEPWQAEGFGDNLELSADAAPLGPLLFPPIQGDRTEVEVLFPEPDAWEGTVPHQGEIAQEDPTTAPEETTPRSGTPLHRGIPGEQPFMPQRIPFRPRTDITTQSKPYVASPGITVMTPSGYGAGWGSAGFGLGLQERTRFTDSSDGVAGFGIGFGNPRDNIGLTVGVTVTDLWGDAFEDGSVSLKLHRQLPNDFGIAAGIQGALTWGETDGGTSGYGVVTKRFVLDEPENLWSQVYVTLGVGGGQYRSESDIEAGEGTVGLFGSVALRVAPPVSAIAEWTGQDLTLGVSVVPFRNIPLVISPAITDITGSAGDGTRFILGIGYGLTFDRL